MFPMNAERCRQPDLKLQLFLSLLWMRITPPNLNWQWIFSSIQDKWLKRLSVAALQVSGNIVGMVWLIADDD